MHLQLSDETNLTLTAPITFVIGANGYGKSTRLKTIRQPLIQNRKKVLDFDVTDSNLRLKTQTMPTGSDRYIYDKPDTILFDIDMHSGYNYHTLLGFSVGNNELDLKEIGSTSEAYMTFIILKLIRKKLEFLEEIGYDGQVLILLDGVDSGTTPDVATSYAKYIQQLIAHTTLDLKIVVTSNTFEFLNPVEYDNPDYLDARTLDKLDITSHQDFVDFVLSTSSAKDIIVY